MTRDRVWVWEALPAGRRALMGRLVLLAPLALLLGGCLPSMLLMQQAAPVPPGKVQAVTGLGGVLLAGEQTGGTNAGAREVAVLPVLEQGLRVGMTESADFGVRLSLPTFALVGDVNLRLLDGSDVDLLIDPAISVWAPALLGLGSSATSGTTSFGVLHGYLPLTLVVHLGAHNLLLSARSIFWLVQVNHSTAATLFLGGTAAMDFNLSGTHVVPELGVTCVPEADTSLCAFEVAVGFGYGTGGG